MSLADRVFQGATADDGDITKLAFDFRGGRADQQRSMRLAREVARQGRVVATLVLAAENDPKPPFEGGYRFESRINVGGF